MSQQPGREHCDGRPRPRVDRLTTVIIYRIHRATWSIPRRPINSCKRSQPSTRTRVPAWRYWGAGGTFSSGHDLKFAATLADPEKFWHEVADRLALDAEGRGRGGRVRAWCALGPLSPRQQPHSGRFGRSASCQFQTFALETRPECDPAAASSISKALNPLSGGRDRSRKRDLVGLAAAQISLTESRCPQAMAVVML
jgi:hypothetical protein